MTVVDFTLSNARRFFSSMGNPSDMKALMNMIVTLVFGRVQMAYQLRWFISMGGGGGKTHPVGYTEEE